MVQERRGKRKEIEWASVVDDRGQGGGGERRRGVGVGGRGRETQPASAGQTQRAYSSEPRTCQASTICHLDSLQTFSSEQIGKN